MVEQHSASAGPRRVVVVGPCASGKSTLVRHLRALGYDAVACGQEHSEIPALWRHATPDVLIALRIDLATVRRRRGDDWPERLHEIQKHRLAPAFAAADLVLDSTAHDAEALLAAVVHFLRGSDVGATRTRSESAEHR